MNYRHAYMRIIANAKSENRKKLPRTNPNYIYYENHHILPKSIFPLWRKRKSNMVLLTPREHFFCHQLLVKIYENDREKFMKMSYALFKFTALPHADYKITSKEYARIKENLSKATSILFTGRKQTSEWIRKRTESMQATRKANPHCWSNEERQRHLDWLNNHKTELSAAQKEGWTDEVKVSFSEKKKEYYRTHFKEGELKKIQKERLNRPDVRKKMSEARKGKKLYKSTLTGEAHYYFEGQQPENFVLISKKGR